MSRVFNRVTTKRLKTVFAVEVKTRPNTFEDILNEKRSTSSMVRLFMSKSVSSLRWIPILFHPTQRSEREGTCEIRRWEGIQWYQARSSRILSYRDDRVRGEKNQSVWSLEGLGREREKDRWGWCVDINEYERCLPEWRVMFVSIELDVEVRSFVNKAKEWWILKRKTRSVISLGCIGLFSMKPQ